MRVQYNHMGMGWIVDDRFVDQPGDLEQMKQIILRSPSLNMQTQIRILDQAGNVLVHYIWISGELALDIASDYWLERITHYLRIPQADVVRGIQDWIVAHGEV